MTLSENPADPLATGPSSPTKAVWAAICGKDVEAGHLSLEDADTVLFWLIASITLFGLALVGIIVFSVVHAVLA